MSDPPPDQRTPRSGGDNPTAEQINRVAATFEAYASQGEATQAKTTKHNRKIRRWTRAATIGALVYTLITATILITTIRSIQETQRATHIASRAADAATAQAKISEDTEKRQLRAYVFVDKASVTLDGLTLRGVVDLKNAGQTPAYDLVVKSLLQTDEAGKPFIPKPFDKVELDRTILGPGGSVYPRSELTIPPDNTVAIPALKKGQAVIYMVGQARYRDAFDRDWILDFRLRSYSFESGSWILHSTEEGNKESQK